VVANQVEFLDAAPKDHGTEPDGADNGDEPF
jgi:hypothetical protein